MKLSDELILKSLRADALSGLADDHWDLVCKAVDDAGDIREVRGYARTVICDAIEKFNPYHDELGQFTSGGSGGGTGGAKFTGARGGGAIPHGGTKASLERAKANQLARTKRSQSEFLDTTDIEPDMGTGAKSGKSSDAPTLDGMKVKQVKSDASTVKRIMRALYDDNGHATSASEIASWVKNGDLKPSEVPEGWRSRVEAHLVAQQGMNG